LGRRESAFTPAGKSRRNFLSFTPNSFTLKRLKKVSSKHVVKAITAEAWRGGGPEYLGTGN